MANQEHLEILLSGIYTWNKWREENPEITPNLRWADLIEADLSEANLRGAYLRWANLSGADLRGADLSGAEGIIHIQFAGFPTSVQDGMITIGCESKPIEEWLSLSDADAEELGADPAHLPAYRLLIEAAHEALKTLE